MGKMKFEDKSKTNFFKAKGFMLALGIGLLAIAAGAWSTVGNITVRNMARTNESIYNPSINYEEEVNKQQSGITYPELSTTTSKATIITTIKTTQTNTTSSFFVFPVMGAVITEFSNEQLQFDKTYNDWRLHTGLDIAGEKGKNIQTAGDGTVRDIYDDPLYGTTIEISHGEGLTTLYAGVTNVRVKKGESVEVGKVIASIGTVKCEMALEPHLHFAVKKDGKFVAPIDTLKIKIR